MNGLKEIVCPACKGTGIYWFIDWVNYNDSKYEYEEVCSLCHGRCKILVEDENYYEDEDNQVC